MKRGILGVKKDPKNPMLLFTAGDPWPSDDSNDSDYEVTSNKKTKSKHRSKSSNESRSGGEQQLASNDEQSVKGKLVLKCRKVHISDETAGDSPNNKTKRIHWERDIGTDDVTDSKHFEKDESNADSCIVDGWGTAIPLEILIRIFQFVVTSEGVLPFLQRAPRVCKHWALAACDSSLWTRTDLSLSKVNITEKKLEYLCRKHMKATKEIVLSGWGAKLTTKGIEAVLGSCKSLTSVGFSGCKNVTATVMKRIVDTYPNLTSIDLSLMAPTTSSESPINSNSIKYIVSKCGASLTYLSLAENILCAVPAVIKNLTDFCPKLRVLDMSNVMTKDRSTITINVEKLQQSWPDLKVLRLANVSCRLANTSLSEQASSPGFPQLEELSIARITDGYYQGWDDNGLARVLKTSHKLKLLDVRGCARITASGLIRFPAFDLEYLFLSQCPAAMTADLELVIEKWRHSLVEVDLSWNNISGEVVDQAVKSLASSPKKSFLHTLNLSGSAVSYEPVKAILSNCSKLSILNLTSCRSLPRGIKRMYVEKELQAFREDVEALNDADVDDT